MKLPDAPFVYLVFLSHSGNGRLDTCELLHKTRIQVANAIEALDPAEQAFPTTDNTKYLWRLRTVVLMAGSTHNVYVVGADVEHSTEDIRHFIRGLPPVQRRDYLIDKDW